MDRGEKGAKVVRTRRGEIDARVDALEDAGRRGRFVPFTSKADRGMAVEGTKAGSDK